MVVVSVPLSPVPRRVNAVLQRAQRERDREREESPAVALLLQRGGTRGKVSPARAAQGADSAGAPLRVLRAQGNFHSHLYIPTPWERARGIEKEERRLAVNAQAPIFSLALAFCPSDMSVASCASTDICVGE